MGEGRAGERQRPLPGRVREPRWPAALAVLAALALYVTLPEQLTVGPTWIFPVLALALLVPLVVTAPAPRPGMPSWARLLLDALPQRQEVAPPWQRLVSIALIALLNAANVGNLILLASSLLHGSKEQGAELLVAAIKIWLTNVVIFALWYWELDRGGPGARSRAPGEQREAAFLFPQMQMRSAAAAVWRPGFVDYLYLSFTNATAFSPTDTLPLSAWAKLLMLVQSLASLLTVALVAARAVNILS